MGLSKLEHEHDALSRRVSELRGRVERKEIDQDFVEALAVLADELFEHFAREEEGLFPFLLEHLPDETPAVAEMQSAHDRICGAASRIASLQERGDLARQLDLAVSLFRRFDAEYTVHARREAELLRSLGQRLPADAQTELAEVLEGL